MWKVVVVVVVVAVDDDDDISRINITIYNRKSYRKYAKDKHLIIIITITIIHFIIINHHHSPTFLSHDQSSSLELSF
jgi:hypothetical protein